MIFLLYSIFVYSLSPQTCVHQMCFESLQGAKDRLKYKVPSVSLFPLKKQFSQEILLSRFKKVDIETVVDFLRQKHDEVSLFHFYRFYVRSSSKVESLYERLLLKDKGAALFFLLLYSEPEYSDILNALMQSEVFMQIVGDYKDFTTFFEYVQQPYIIFLFNCYREGINHILLPSSLKVHSNDSDFSAFIKMVFSLYNARKLNLPYPLDSFETQLLSSMDIVSFKGHQDGYRFFPLFCGSIVFYSELSFLKKKILPYLLSRHIRFTLVYESEDVFFQMIPYLNPLYDGGTSILLFDMPFTQIMKYVNRRRDKENSIYRCLRILPLLSLEEIKGQLLCCSCSEMFFKYILLNYSAHDFSAEEQDKVQSLVYDDEMKSYFKQWLAGQLVSFESQYKLIVDDVRCVNLVSISKRSDCVHFLVNRSRELFSEYPYTRDFIRQEVNCLLPLFSFPSDVEFKQDVEKAFSVALPPVRIDKNDLYLRLSSLEKLTLLGRTVYGFCSQTHKWVAFKFQKKGETTQEFMEANAFHHVLQNYLDRNVPIAKGVFKVNDVLSILPFLFPNQSSDDFKIFVQNEQKESTFRIYEVEDEGFFRYPYDPNYSIDQVAHGLTESVRTFGLLWGKGYYLHSVSEMFHNGVNRRNYIPATFLLEEVMGVLQSWDTQAISTPDTRISGIMDMEDGLFELSPALDEAYKKNMAQLSYRLYPFEQRNNFFKLNTLVSILFHCDLTLFHLYNEKRLNKEKLTDIMKNYYKVLFQAICKTREDEVFQLVRSSDFEKYVSDALLHTSFQQTYVYQNGDDDLRYLRGLTPQGFKEFPNSPHTNLGGFNQNFPIYSFIDMMSLFLFEIYVCLSKQDNVQNMECETVLTGNLSELSLSEEMDVQNSDKNNFILNEQEGVEGMEIQEEFDPMEIQEKSNVSCIGLKRKVSLHNSEYEGDLRGVFLEESGQKKLALEWVSRDSIERGVKGRQSCTLDLLCLQHSYCIQQDIFLSA